MFSSLILKSLDLRFILCDAVTVSVEEMDRLRHFLSQTLERDVGLHQYDKKIFQKPVPETTT